MRPTLHRIASLLIAFGVGGLALTASGHADRFWAPLASAWLAGPTAALPFQRVVSTHDAAPTGGESPADDQDRNGAPEPLAIPDEYREIDRVRIPSIDLVAEVVPAQLAELPQGVSWAVPPFKVGHGGGTAGAGQTGNSVLFGHISSVTLGNVFLYLDRVHPGDLVYVGSGDREFAYVVHDVRSVGRADLTVIQTTPTASITLITCTGVWLPKEQDYAERLVVTGRLA